MIAKSTDVESKIRVEMQEQKVDSIKWLVGLFITLTLMIIGLYLKK